jgi:hypothetical protein
MEYWIQMKNQMRIFDFELNKKLKSLFEIRLKFSLPGYTREHSEPILKYRFQ